MRVPSQEPRAKVSLGPPYPIPLLLYEGVSVKAEEESLAPRHGVYTPIESSLPAYEKGLHVPILQMKQLRLQLKQHLDMPDSTAHISSATLYSTQKRC